MCGGSLFDFYSLSQEAMNAEIFYSFALITASQISGVIKSNTAIPR